MTDQSYAGSAGGGPAGKARRAAHDRIWGSEDDSEDDPDHGDPPDGADVVAHDSYYDEESE
eukprot:7127548-Pyramimonas_sp.AAC.1